MATYLSSYFRIYLTIRLYRVGHTTWRRESVLVYWL